MRSEGHAVESICQVLGEQGCQVAARTYRSWKQPDRAVAERTITDAVARLALELMFEVRRSPGLSQPLRRPLLRRQPGAEPAP